MSVTIRIFWVDGGKMQKSQFRHYIKQYPVLIKLTYVLEHKFFHMHL